MPVPLVLAFFNMENQYLVFLLIVFISTVLSCKETPATDDAVLENKSTYDHIQSEIWDKKCITCHVAGNSAAKQSGLILTSDVSYENLINVIPKNQAAAEDKLVRVENAGLESLAKSFLCEKINAANQEHYYLEHPAYGELMPPGSLPLTNGEIEFIRQWIEKGAPRKGEVANLSVLDNETYFIPDTDPFEPLSPPSKGIQLHLGPFDVATNYERELYAYYPLENTNDIYINRIESSMRPGTHHLILYDFKEGATLPPAHTIRDIRDENGNYIPSSLQSLSNQVFTFGTQFRKTDYKYPEGVALRISPNHGFDINTHYTNYSPLKLEGEVFVNLHTVDKNEVQYEAKSLFLNRNNITLPPKQETTLTSEYTFNDTRSIFMLTAHGHKQMEEFRIYIKGGPRDGELIYYTNDWEHPEIKEYETPIELKPGEGLRAVAKYNNTTNHTINFGLLSTDEMMIVFGAYYTK